MSTGTPSCCQWVPSSSCGLPLASQFGMHSMQPCWLVLLEGLPYSQVRHVSHVSQLLSWSSSNTPYNGAAIVWNC